MLYFNQLAFLYTMKNIKTNQIPKKGVQVVQNKQIEFVFLNKMNLSMK